LLKERESPHSEEDYYGKSVAAILKRLPPYKRALARCRIDQLLFDIEYGEDNGKEQRRQLGLPKRKEVKHKTITGIERLTLAYNKN